jgi:hypothetical protein
VRAVTGLTVRVPVTAGWPGAAGEGEKTEGATEVAPGLCQGEKVIGFVLLLATAFGFLALIGLAGFWLADRGVEAGDLPGDARSAISVAPDGSLLVEVVNPSPVAVTVGWHLRARQTPQVLQVVTPCLVVRPVRRAERRRPDRGATGFLGAVDAGCRERWSVPAPTVPARIHLVLGQPGSRLRVHDHLVPTRASVGSV